MKSKSTFSFVTFGLLFLATLSSGATPSPIGSPVTSPKPKYGSAATRLFNSHEYVKKNLAPDYWAISPYYTAQQTGAACSIASVTMVVNAARAKLALTADDELVSQDSLLKKTQDEKWKKAVTSNGGGVTLDQLRPLIEKSFKVYGFPNAHADVFHAQKSDEFRKTLHDALVENEKSADDFIVANFNQGVFTGDADAGHIAPVGAYDAVQKKVLIMDPDRQWYEPYWVSEDVFVDGMATGDPTSGMTRGFVWVHIQ